MSANDSAPATLAQLHQDLQVSRSSLLESIGHPKDITILRSWGNWGDVLIYAGLRSLLRDSWYSEYDIRSLDQAPPGDLAIIAGGGAWCIPFHAMPAFLPLVEKRFQRVVVFPSTFDAAEPSVREALAQTRALIFARERRSYEQVRSLCKARLAHDTAFFFDFRPYHTDTARGVLQSFRTDAEATGEPLPGDNHDISVECASLDEWLWTIARHELIRTDRAHVVIAAAMLGKHIEYRPSSYHKIPGIIEYCIPSDLASPLDAGHHQAGQVTPELAQEPWHEKITRRFRGIRSATLALKKSLGRSGPS